MLQLRTQPLSRAWLRFPPHLRLCLESLSGAAGRRHLGRHASTCDKELKGKSCREEMPGCAWRLQQSGVLGPSETAVSLCKGKEDQGQTETLVVLLLSLAGSVCCLTVSLVPTSLPSRQI